MGPSVLHHLSTLLPPASPHPVVLPGFLLFPGGYVRPDHVGDAPHPGRRRAEVQGPHPLPR